VQGSHYGGSDDTSVLGRVVAVRCACSLDRFQQCPNQSDGQYYPSLMRKVEHMLESDHLHRT